MSPDNWVYEHSAAAVIGRSPETLRRWYRLGLISQRKKSGIYQYRLSELKTAKEQRGGYADRDTTR